MKFLNALSLGLVAVALLYFLKGKQEEAGFVMLLAIYIDGRLFLYK